MKRNSICIIFSLILFSSCYIKGLKNGYKQLTPEQKNKVIFNSDNCFVLYNDTTYAYNATNFKNCLKENTKTLLYVWDANCKSKSCIPLTACQLFCDKNGYELVVLLEYFDIYKQQQFGNPKNALIISDFNFYRTNFTDKCNNKFIQSLTGKDKKDSSIRYRRFFFFEGENFKYAKDNLF